jgi:hypothetical protein
MAKNAALADVVPTLMSGGQCWGARTRDGEWGMDRLEDKTTSWEVVYRPTSTVVADFLASLRQCRLYVGSGAAQQDLERLQAHERGEHEHERDGECERCAP